MKVSTSQSKYLKIGDIFTPIAWGKFVVKEFNLFDKWIKGATIFDPTMGEGHLLTALIDYGLQKNYTRDTLPIYNLYGNEINKKYYDNALNKFKQEYNCDMINNFANKDVLSLKKCNYDILLGNPPWQNFVDLPADYKEKIKTSFFEYDLAKNKKDLLLGGSRIDIAALIIQYSIKKFLKKNGEAIFFLPLSLFLNEGTHENFRKYRIGTTRFSVDVIYDFNDKNIFAISTRYGIAHFTKDKNTKYPILYKQMKKNKWISLKAEPIITKISPLSIRKKTENKSHFKINPIYVSKKSKARQGINCCGANSIFFFDTYSNLDDAYCLINNTITLPKTYIYPLVTTKNFKENSLVTNKWVLLPYQKNGKPLELSQIKKEKHLYNYLKNHETILKNRKGVMINSYMKNEKWWALLGVGAYNFAAYKVIWESYGKRKFSPKILPGKWQANQSLHSYIPCDTLNDAQRIVLELKNPKIEKYLLSLKMEGTMNWAQPKKINQFLTYAN